MKLKYKDLIKALNAIEDERRVPEEVVLEALKEAMSKAYKKDAELSDISVETEINERRGTIDIYQLYTVTNEDDIEDDELQMSLEDAREINPDAQIGDTVRREVEISTMSRAAATLARNVIRQKIREAEKVSVYNEYINQLNEMVLGIVESVKDKFVLVNLGKTVAMMPKSNQIPNERLTEGQKLRVVITEVNKESKGPQVLVSRSSEMLVKRLFEKEVPEIYQGVVEIKAIARDAGERTKMAVVSHNEEIDPIGACIGQRGGRVQEIIEELHGEKIDIFLWSEDITQLVKNALAPAAIEAVLPDDEGKGLLVIVNDDQLSLAIGRKGKNARLAVKLCDKKIDIKTRGEIEEMGKDYDELIARAAEQHAEYEKELARKREERKLAEAKADEEKRLIYGPNIKDWPEMSPLAENILLKVSSKIMDTVTTTDELIPSGETSSFRSNPLGLAEFTLSRRDPEYVGRSKKVDTLEKARVAGKDILAEEPELVEVFEKIKGIAGQAEVKPQETEIGSMVYAVKPGDGSAREQAASCQRVIGGLANICQEYATKRYRSNVMNWGMIPFQMKEEPEFEVDDYIYIPGIRKMMQEDKLEDVKAYVIGKDGVKEISLYTSPMTDEERKIVEAGSLINYNRNKR